MKRLILNVFIVLLSMSYISLARAEYYDIVIKNGLVFDGTGQVGARLSVAIKDGKISYVGVDDTRSAGLVIDARGLVVAPGFIDVHNHADFLLKSGWDLSNESYLRQGVTTVVTGPDGAFAPDGIKRVRDFIKANGSSTNIAVYIGHNGVREAVMGLHPALATNEQLSQMKNLVKEGMEMGAVGLSTGLMYVPGMYSDTDEVVALAKVAASYGGIYDSHVRSPVKALIASYQEVIEIGERAGLPVKIGHAKLVGLSNGHLFPQVRRLINDARDRGVYVVSDQYPYDGAANVWLWEMIVLPKDMMPTGSKGLTRGWVAGLLKNSETRKKLKEFNEEASTDFSWVKAVGYTSMRIVVCNEQPELVGTHISELAQARGKDAFDVVADLITNEDVNVNITLGSVAEDNVRQLLVQPWNMISSDGAWSDAAGKNAVSHPRSTGTYPRVLGRYVREEGLLDLSAAIYKMTSFPANFLGLSQRGKIQEGFVADIAIFDPKEIIDQSDWVNPARLSIGMKYVLVNGKLALDNAKMTGEMSGRFLRRQKSD